MKITKPGRGWLNSRRSVRDIALLMSIALGACAAFDQEEEIVTRTLSPLEGYWTLNEAPNTVLIKPCETGSKKLCGRLVAFGGDPNARDDLNPHFFDWGQKICNSAVVYDLAPTDKPQIYAGRLYDPEEGENLNLIVLMKSHNVIEARVSSRSQRR